MQSQEEILRIFDEWGRHYAPSNMVQNEKNAILLADYVLKTYGIASITYLTQAANALAPQLDLIPEKKQPTEADKANRENARTHQDWLKSLEPQTTLYQQKLGQARLDSNKRDALALELKTVLGQIESEIGNFCVGHASGHQNYSATNDGKQTLRSVRDQYPRKTLENAKACLSAVRTKKASM